MTARTDVDQDGLYSYAADLGRVLDAAVDDHAIYLRAGCAGVSPLDALIRDLAVARHDAIRRRDHQHVWSSCGYCVVCGQRRTS
jgi:hypothetical protein